MDEKKDWKEIIAEDMLIWCNYAREILCDYLMTKKENKELKEELEDRRKFNDELLKSSQKVQGAWISALLNNDIQVTPKEQKNDKRTENRIHA